MKSVLKFLGNYVKRIDKILLLICVGLSAFDIFLVNTLYENGYVSESTVKTQFFAAVLGFGASIIVGMIDYKLMSKLWFIYAPIALGLQLLLFTSLGVQRDDDIAWLDFGFFTIQPSEILKIAYILTLSTQTRIK